jgi:hypothetical protein
MPKFYVYTNENILLVNVGVERRIWKVFIMTSHTKESQNGSEYRQEDESEEARGSVVG